MKITRRDLCRTALLAGAMPLGNSLLNTLGGRSAFAGEATGTESVVLTLLHTNDPHGHVHLAGQPQGLVKIATMVRQIRREMPNVLLLDAGDLIHGTPEEKAFEGRPILAAMNAMQYDAATAGNHEFDFGQRITQQAIELARFPILSANVLDEKTGRPWKGLKPYIMRDVKGLRVAIFGLTTLDTVPLQFPRTLQGIHFADPFDTAQRLVPQLRKEERADIVVFLSHLGYKQDRKMAETVSGIDIILGGHSHSRLAEQVWVNGTLIMQTGCYGRALGRADVQIERTAGGNAKLTINGRDGRWWGRDGVPAPLNKTYPAAPLLDITPDIAEDGVTLAAYRPFETTVQKRRAEILTTADEALPVTGVKEHEIALGTLLAEAVRTRFGVDIGMIPSGAIVKGLPAGKISVADATDTIGGYTRQHIVTARVPGKQLRLYSEQIHKSNQQAAQISGLDLSGKDPMVGGRPLQDNKIYTVAAPAYLIQDHFLGQAGVVILNDDPEAPTTRDAITEFLRNRRLGRDFLAKPQIADRQASISFFKRPQPISDNGLNLS